MKRIIWIPLFVIFFFSVANLALSKDNFRFSLDYYGSDVFGLRMFEASRYSFSSARSLDSYKPFKVGDLLLLLEKSEIAFGEDNRRFGFGLEVRIFKEGWLTLNYYQTGKIRMTNSETLDKARVVAILTHDIEWDVDSGFIPVFWKKGTYFSKDVTEQETGTTIYGRNLRIGSRYRFSLFHSKRIYFFFGLGADIWQVNHKTMQNLKFGYLHTDTGERNGIADEIETEKLERRYILKGFLENGAELLLSKNLIAGVVVSFYNRGKRAEFGNDLLLVPGDFWKTDIERASFRIFLSIGY